MSKKECVAMLLAGGQGSRLGTLTKKIAKPAVPFGGKYRIIDFPLSNCYNSGIDTVGVLTQYKPFALHSYIGIGSAWDLDRKNGGVYVLPPYVMEDGGEWYKGTAHAIYQNISFIDAFDPQYVLVLSGDHVYKMDYSLLIEYHKSHKADATISVIEVAWEEASRFGIMNTDTQNRITEFEEKPKKPKSNKASMGVYVFNWKLLRRYLREDTLDEKSKHDFGQNIIPRMLRNGQKLYAYSFGGYWKDVGTVKSFWQANMDLLGDTPRFDLFDPEWRIYSVNPTRPPHYIGSGAKAAKSLISEGAIIFGEVYNSVIFPGVRIEAGAVVKDSVIMPYSQIKNNSILQRTIVCRRAIIQDGCTIGGPPEQIGEITVIDEKTSIAANSIVPAPKENRSAG